MRWLLDMLEFVIRYLSCLVVCFVFSSLSLSLSFYLFLDINAFYHQSWRPA